MDHDDTHIQQDDWDRCDFDRQLVDEYRTMLRRFRDGDARPFEVYAAAVLDAATTVIDPGGVMYLDSDPTVGDQYDIVNSRVWKRFVDAARSGRLDAAAILSILRDEYGDNFGTRTTLASDGIVEQVHQGTADDAPAATADVARLVHARLERSEAFGEPRLFVTDH